MKFFPVAIFSILTIFILTACGGGTSGGGGGGGPTFNLTCAVGVTYAPFAAPMETSPAGGGATTTVIALHGKNGVPGALHMNTLSTSFNNAGYDVVRPYLPWSNTSTPTEWNGSLCDGMSYIDSLIDAEIGAGKSVILLGHSLAGPIVLAYSALTNTTKPDALAVLAPGHFVHDSNVLAGLHAPSIATAESMVMANNGDVVASFETSNGGVMQDIDATANIYLSFHSTNQFPNLKASIPLAIIPTIWLAGNADPLTNSAIALGIISVVNTRSNYDYREITGGHINLVSNVTAELDPWYLALP